ncbi:MAG: 2-dehydropantoate 2-reductase [Thermodesulfobacteriota bacterium]
MRIAVLGTGGIGGYYGGMLARAGEDVTFIARQSHLKAIRSKGLKVKTTHVGEFIVPAIATDNPSDIGKVDLLLLCVKTYDTGKALSLVSSLIGSETSILILQNGIESIEEVNNVLKGGHAIGSAAYISSKIESPGVILQSWIRTTYIGEFDKKITPRINDIFRVFRKAAIPVELSDDIWSAIWSKLIGISSFSALSCATRQPAGIIFNCTETSNLYWVLINEGISVARACGAIIPNDYVDVMQNIIAAFPPTMKASMHYDLEAGRQLELDDLIGSIVRSGEKHCIAIPATSSLYAVLKPYAKGAPSII